MTTQRSTAQWLSLRHFLSALMLLLSVTLALRLAKPVLAATITLAGQASCEALGGRWNGICRLDSVSIAAGDTLVTQVWTEVDVSVTNNGTLTIEDYLFSRSSFTNNAGATVNSTFILDVRGITNAGVINVSGRGMILSSDSTNRSTGQIRVRNGGTLTVSPRFGSLTNEGTIIIECGGAMVYDATTFSGNPPQYLCPPTVTIDQAAGQADPTLSNPLLFTVGFNRAVSGFTAADVTLSGTADRTNATVSVSGGPIGYTVAVNGISGEGTVIASINAGVAVDVSGNANLASTSTDNSITFLPPLSVTIN